MRYKKNALCIGTIFLFLLSACDRESSIQDIPSVEETGTIDWELVNQMGQEQKGNLEQITGNNFALTPYIADSHFYEKQATTNWWGKTKLVPVQTTIDNWFITENLIDGGEYFATQEKEEQYKKRIRQSGCKTDSIRYLFLDVTIENKGDEMVDYTPGNLGLFDRVEDDTYVSEGFADKRIDDVSPGMEDNYGETIYNQQIFSLYPGQIVQVRMFYIMDEDYTGHTLCVGVSGFGGETYNEETKRHEPTTDENIKYIYLN